MRSMCSGWCTIAATGTPSACTPSSPKPSDWLSSTTSKRCLRISSGQRSSSRKLNVVISGKTPKRVSPSSHRFPGLSERQPEEILVRDHVERNARRQIRQRRARDHVHLVPELVQLAREVGGVDPL